MDPILSVSASLAPYPDMLIPPSEKNSDFIMQYGRAMLSAYFRYNTNIGYINLSQYEVNRLYSMGLQDIKQYQNQVDIGADEDGSYNNIDWAQLAIGAKYHNLVKGMMAKNGYRVNASAINPASVEKKLQEKYRDEFNFLFKDQLSEIYGNLNAQDPNAMAQNNGKPDFMSLDELNMYYETDYKSAEEIAAIDGWNCVADSNDWNNVLKEQLSGDLYDYGVCGVRDYVDSNGVIKLKRINVEYLITGWSERPDFKDCPHFGEIVFYTVAELKQLTSSSPQKITEDDWEMLAKTYLGFYNNPYTFSSTSNINTTRPYDGIRIPVLDFEFESVNRYESYQDSEGRILNHGTINEEAIDNMKKIRKDIKVLYKGQWIINTKFIFNAGLVQNLKRREGSLQDVLSNWHLYAPTKKGMRVKSMAENIIPNINNIHLAWYKMQAALAKARPKGLAIDIQGITGITKGDGNVYSPLEIIEIFDATGNMLYKSTDDSGKPLANGRLPLMEIENGMAADVFRFVDIINFNQRVINDLLGFNEVSAGANPNPEVGKAQSEMALASTNNVLQPFFTAYKSVLERTARSCIQRLQDISKNGVKGYINALGKECLAVLGSFPDMSLCDFGIMIESEPNDMEIAILNDMINRELAVRSQGGGGGITFADAVAIRDIMKYNPKKAAKMLDIRKQRHAAEDAKIQQANSQANAQMQAQVAQEAMAMKMQMETEKIKLQEELKGQREAMLEQVRNEAKLMLQQMVNDGLKDIQEMKSATDVIIQDAKNHADMEAKDMAGGYNLMMKQMDIEGRNGMVHDGEGFLPPKVASKNEKP